MNDSAGPLSRTLEPEELVRQGLTFIGRAKGHSSSDSSLAWKAVE